MFTNLIESESHRKEFKRRSSFFLVTVAAYALIMFAAGIASIYAYDARLVRSEETAPVPIRVKQKTQPVASVVLTSKAISLPKPAYPQMAKQINVEGPVAVQIVVDEQGRVISAQPVSGHPILLHAAKEAALQARFTPTVLNGQPVKIQGVITYNFVLH